MRLRRFGLAILCMSIFSWPASQLRAQMRQSIVSPEIHQNHDVTFRLRAPQAKQVELEAGFVQNNQPMKKDENGLWSITLGPVEPDIYEYNFLVDGLQVVDPSNCWLKVWLRNSKNLVEIPGDELAVPWAGVKFSTSGKEIGQNVLGSGLIGQYQKGPDGTVGLEIVYPFDVTTADMIYPFPQW